MLKYRILIGNGINPKKTKRAIEAKGLRVTFGAYADCALFFTGEDEQLRTIRQVPGVLAIEIYEPRASRYRKNE